MISINLTQKCYKIKWYKQAFGTRKMMTVGNFNLNRCHLCASRGDKKLKQHFCSWSIDLFRRDFLVDVKEYWINQQTGYFYRFCTHMYHLWSLHNIVTHLYVQINWAKIGINIVCLDCRLFGATQHCFLRYPTSLQSKYFYSRKAHRNATSHGRI